jgi:hypothetical protein
LYMARLWMSNHPSALQHCHAISHKLVLLEKSFGNLLVNEMRFAERGLELVFRMVWSVMSLNLLWWYSQWSKEECMSWRYTSGKWYWTLSSDSCTSSSFTLGWSTRSDPSWSSSDKSTSRALLSCHC